MTGSEIKSLLCVPLKVKAGTIGIMEVINKQNGVFTQEDEELLSYFADHAAISIARTQFMEDQRNYEIHLTDILVDTMDTHIHEKAGHSKRVAKYSLMMADELNMPEDEKRKLYTYNTIHAVYAYLGKQKRYQFIIESIQDQAIQQMAIEALNESSRALQKEFGYSNEEMKEWNRRVLKNMANPFLKDKIDRVGADPIRKLKKEDRLIGPALMCIRNGIMPYFLAKAVAAAFLFVSEEDQASSTIQEYLKNHSIKEAIREFCQLDREVELIQLISEHYQKFLNKITLEKDFYKIKKLKECYEIGFEYEKNYRGCAQCLIATFFKFTGKTNNTLFQSASGLSGGMALCGDSACGGYSGGIMIMGSYVGRRLEKLDLDGDKEAQYKAYEMAQKLHDKFIETYGSVICADIHKQIFGKSFCLRSKEVRKEFEEAGAHLDKCTTVVAMAASWVADILNDEGYL